jgi:hypothetical protein
MNKGKIMGRTSTNMKNVFYLILSMTIMCCGVEREKTNLPRLQYDRDDFETMVKTLRADSSYTAALEKRATEGDTLAVKMQTLLRTPYDSIVPRNIFTEEELITLLHTFNISKETMSSFDSTSSSTKEGR